MDKEGLAYCAGLYEGEGTVGCYISKSSNLTRPNGKIYVQGPRRQIRLSIRMSDLEPLYYFADITNAGKLSGPHYTKLGNKSMYMYRAFTFEHVQYIMTLLWSHLSPRRKEQFKLAVTKYLEFGRLI